jgi:ABC-type glycerol-3-phosphate transport system substrate-binding protein
MKDVLWHDWYTAHGLSPNLDTPAEALQLFSGEGLDWREPRYYDHWAKLQQLWQAGYLNDDIMSIDLYPGIDLFSTGKSAMTWTVVPLLQSIRDMLGPDNVGVFVWPASGQGKLNGMPIADTNGFCISSQSRHKELAAEFIKLTQTQERMTALWNTCNALPTSTGWDGRAVIADPWWQDVWARWVHGKTTVYVNEMMPSLVLSDAVNVNTEKAILGTFTPEQCGENAYNVVQKWREQNPDILEKYVVWANSMAKVWAEEYA